MKLPSVVLTLPRTPICLQCAEAARDCALPPRPLTNGPLRRPASCRHARGAVRLTKRHRQSKLLAARVSGRRLLRAREQRAPPPPYCCPYPCPYCTLTPSLPPGGQRARQRVSLYTRQRLRRRLHPRLRGARGRRGASGRPGRLQAQLPDARPPLLPRCAGVRRARRAARAQSAPRATAPGSELTRRPAAPRARRASSSGGAQRTGSGGAGGAGGAGAKPDKEKKARTFFGRGNRASLLLQALGGGARPAGDAGEAPAGVQAAPPPPSY